MNLAHADRGTKIRGLGEHGITKYLFDDPMHSRKLAREILCKERQKRQHGEPLLEKEALHDIFVHAYRGSKHTAAYVGKSGGFQQSLYGAVLSVRTVKQGKDDFGAGIGSLPGNGGAKVHP